MWIVTPRTIAVFYRLMNHISHLQLFVTFIAECLNIIYFQKGMLVPVFLFMTENAIAGGHRAMDIGLFSHTGVTIASGA